MSPSRLLPPLVLLLAGCASAPADDHPPPDGAVASAGDTSFVGAWRAADAEMGTMSLDVGADLDCVLIGVDGQRFEFEAEEEDDLLRARIEVGNPGLKILFGPEATDEVEGTINFAMGFAEASFRRPAGQELLEATFWRRSRPQDTRKTVRMRRAPSGPR